MNEMLAVPPAKKNKSAATVGHMATNERCAMTRKHWITLMMLLIAAMGSLLLFGPDKVVWWWDIHVGKRLILRVESFRQQHDHLPRSLGEVDAIDVDENKYFYEKCSDSHYIIWFGTELGESMTYDSDSRSWTSINIGCRSATTM
jgi:hypothetical protein